MESQLSLRPIDDSALRFNSSGKHLAVCPSSSAVDRAWIGVADIHRTSARVTSSPSTRSAMHPHASYNPRHMYVSLQRSCNIPSRYKPDRGDSFLLAIGVDPYARVISSLSPMEATASGGDTATMLETDDAGIVTFGGSIHPLRSQQ